MGITDPHRENDVSAENPGGENYLTNGKGDQLDAWGGQSAHYYRTPYTGGWHTSPGNPIPSPNDKAAYSASQHFTPSGRQQDVERYRQMGQDAQGRGGINLNYGGAEDWFNKAQSDRTNAQVDRVFQNDALAKMRGAANGTAPSQAQLLGQNMIDRSLQAQMAGAAGARGGPLAQMAAQRQVANNAASFQAQGGQQLAAMRANEMADARNAYMQGASGIRAQDYQGAQQAMGAAGQQAQMAQAQGQLTQQQRQLNQQAQMGYEGMAYDVNQNVFNAANNKAALAQQNSQFNKQMQQQQSQQNSQNTAAYVSSAAMLAAMLSDMRAKTPLLLDGKQSKNAPPDWLAKSMDDQQPAKNKALSALGKAGQNYAAVKSGNGPSMPQSFGQLGASLKKQTQADDKASKRGAMSAMVGSQLPQGAPNAPLPAPVPTAFDAGGGDISRDDPYAGPTPGGIQREDPYGSGEVFFSDEKTKERGGDVVPIGDSDEGVLQSTPEGRAYYRKPLEAPEPHPAFASKGPTAKPATPAAPKAQPKRREPTPDEMMAWANKTQGEMGQEHQQRMAQGPAVKSNNLTELQKDANRRMAGFPYAYKPEFTPPEQAPGELNYGFSAQELEKNPITATAVRKDPNGMSAVDMKKLVKTQAAGIASLQDQIDQLQGGRRYGR